MKPPVRTTILRSRTRRFPRHRGAAGRLLGLSVREIETLHGALVFNGVPLVFNGIPLVFH
jgi:hypothetical protein